MRETPIRLDIASCVLADRRNILLEIGVLQAS